MQNHKELLIAVVTAPSHEDARTAIRNTWASLSPAQAQRVDVRFFVGQVGPTVSNRESIETELAASPDVVRLDFLEHYHNLTLKAKGIFHYAYSSGYSALMKVDDDSYVNVPRLLEYMDAHASSLESIYAGHINRAEWGENTVHRNPSSKWYMYDQYAHDQFPDFADGPGFLLGTRALAFLSQNKDTLFNYRCDDAAVGIWTEPLELSKVDMKVSIYETMCHVDDVLINPVAASEMYSFHHDPFLCGSGYVIEVCLDKPCLCKGHPDRAKCWQEIIDLPYQDIIPR